MSGTTPTPGSEPADENKPAEENPYAQPGGQTTPPAQPWSSEPPPATPPAWSGPVGEPEVPQEPGERPEPPKSILNAVRLMYVGAALSALGLISTFASRDAARDAIADTQDLTESELDAAVNVFIGVGVVVSIIGILLWLWMASANKKGKSWARTVATVLGGLNIVFTLYSIMGAGTSGLGVLLNVVNVVLAVVILWFLYRPDSSQYYAAVSRISR